MKIEEKLFSRTQTSVVIVADIFHVVRGGPGEEEVVGAEGCVEEWVREGGLSIKVKVAAVGRPL